MFFRTKNDINFFKFLEFSSRITDDTDAAHTLEELYLVFKPKDLNQLAKAIETDGKLKRRFKLDLDFDKVGGAGRFIDADTMYLDRDFKGFFNTILKPKRRLFFWRYKIDKNLSLREAEYVLSEWKNYAKDLKDRYEYVYNPPLRIQQGENTQGTYERQLFAEMYGGYMEITYLLTQGKALDEERVWSLGINRFLFRGEYALRKRDVENIK